MQIMREILLTIVLAPLLASAVAGLGGRWVGRVGAQGITIAAVGLSFVLSAYVLWQLLAGAPTFNASIYTWLVSDGLHMNVGFLVDRLSALMMTVVTFVSLMVHVYTIGYMHDDPGYTRFFSYISLFTFAMLTLVMSNNFLQLFFGWEAVGLVSYLLIGFWFTRPSAVFANLKAFLVNRVGDFGFLLGIAAIVHFTGTLDYVTVFERTGAMVSGHVPGLPFDWPAITFVCICLFIGAMGKSAQMPLHVWLPDSMEGPTPISALIHAATMVTAGIFMVARMSPLFELSPTALSFVLIIGASTAFFMGLLGIVANDIKRVIAYSTLSQLGYMTAALGVSAYSAAMFHLMTHAFFKALLFLGAGSVILAMHHEQDLRRMGGLKKYLPITNWTMLIGSLALIGFPGTSGFFSKDSIIEAIGESHRIGSGYAYFCVLTGVSVTALYSFRLFFMAFHGSPRMDEHTRDHLHESPRVITVPLVLLAIPSAFIGWLTIQPILSGGFFGSAIRSSGQGSGETADALQPLHMVLHSFASPVLYMMLAGVATAWVFYLWKPEWPARVAGSIRWLYEILVRKYGFDWFNEHVLAQFTRVLGGALWKGGDELLIDGALVNGSARSVGWVASVVRFAQSGFLYHYAFAMILGLASLLLWLIWRNP